MLKYPDSLRRLIAVAATLTITAILSGGCEKSDPVELRPGRQEKLDWSRPISCPFCRTSSPGNEYNRTSPGRRGCPHCHRDIPEPVLISRIIR